MTTHEHQTMLDTLPACTTLPATQCDYETQCTDRFVEEEYEASLTDDYGWYASERIADGTQAEYEDSLRRSGAEHALLTLMSRAHKRMQETSSQAVRQSCAEMIVAAQILNNTIRIHGLNRAW